MQTIITHLSQKLGLDEAVVAQGLTVLLRFLQEQAAGTQFAGLLEKLPGASELLSSAPAPEAAGGGLGGLLGSMLGGSSGSLARVATQLNEAGVPLDKVVPLAQGFVEEARQAAGASNVDRVLAGIPALQGLLERK